MIGKIAALALLAYTGGLHWIYISLHRFGELPAWLAALSTLLLAAYVALMWCWPLFWFAGCHCRFGMH